MKDLMKFPLNIQLFGDEASNDTQEGNENLSGAEKPKVFTQADIDRAVTAAVKTRDEKHSKALKDAVEEAIAEQKRLAALTEEERKEEARKLADQAVAQKQKELDEKILRFDVGEVLVKRGLSPDLLNFVLGKDLDDSVTKIDVLTEIINKQVEAQIKAVVTKPGVPTRPKTKTLTKKEIMDIKDSEERLRQIALHPELFNYGG
ncbi:DUF4355 domain-containing protein [Erysipelothrix rhusiopathiae]|nr:DUF4355 domain-containing protein [Erysipelothrix rhusiopathiae]MDE8052192.1 DUF4355 domain-containing protein [Erysipelothrix rhusiopathiae]MDE8060612.1 DUF4355 domain-containing protein [Erysipelothrix rhusiopathiae]MDE8065623.1 DUF4355 domain-containing protein [Erysipelothrix rhusiopathiae]MDE8079191.1 DUF4355 domain-containing protein [Erysipelothrix rhusiopathiae]